MIHLALTIAAALFLGYVALLVLGLLFGTHAGRQLLGTALLVGALFLAALFLA